METRSIKPGASVLKFEKGEYALSSKDRSRAEESRLRQRPEREAFRLGGNLLSEGVDRHLRLLLRLPHPDVQAPALSLFFPDHDAVRKPFIPRGPDLLRARVVGVVEGGSPVREAA